MKKQSVLFIAGALMTLASCQNNATDTGANQAQIDSAVNARVEELRTQMMMQNDSLINAEAQRRADSMIAAMGNGAAKPAATPARPTTGTNKTTKPATPVNPKEGRFNGQGSNNTTTKEARFDDAAAEKQKEENAKKKAERFK